MKHLLTDYLAQHWNPDYAQTVRYSLVPKGKEGNLALSFFELTKELKKSPVQIGAEVLEALKDAPFVADISAAGPYVNVTFTPETFFSEVLSAPVSIDDYADRTITIEYSGPNTNKPLHLGHMRNHALGIAMVNLFKAVGANVVPVTIINDRGVHICKSMLAYQRFGNGETPESTGEKSDHFVGRYYREYAIREKEDPSLKDEIQKMLVAWEAGDTEVRALWQKMNDWTLAGHEETYRRQGVSFTQKYYESKIYEEGAQMARDGVQKGVFYEREDGAIMVDLESENLDQKVVLRADGTAIYLTQDLALAVNRQADYQPTEMIYVVADEQNYHFQVLFACLRKLGVEGLGKLFHLGYGLVHLPDGRMKSREGTVVDADPLMDELSTLAAESIRERNPELTDDQVKTTAEQIMNAAWKFYLLSTSPRKAMTFDKDNSIRFEGSTGPYLQYAGVRLRSIFRKAGEDILNTDMSHADLAVFGEEEKQLGVKILQYADVLRTAAEKHNPTPVLTYLLELAQQWSSYYASHSILKAETEELKTARMALGQKVYRVLESGLAVLGIEIPEQM